jgi:hypothetical protein
MRASTIILVPDLIKSLRHHLNSWMRTSADASSTMEMVDPDTGEIISPQTAHAAADPAAYKNNASTATTVSGSLSRRPAGSLLHRRSQLAVSGFDMCSRVVHPCRQGAAGPIIRPGLSEWLAMSSREVTNWLQSHRLGAYVDVFAEHNVTWDELGELGDEGLRKMGLNVPLHASFDHARVADDRG